MGRETMGRETMGRETTGPGTTAGANGTEGADCVVLEQEFVSTEIEPEGDTTASIRLAAARGGRPGHAGEKAPTTGELTRSDRRWFGHKAGARATAAPAVGASATTYV